MESTPEKFSPALEGDIAYLSLLARGRIGRWLQGRLSAADLVQQTFLQALQHREAFRGTSEAE